MLGTMHFISKWPMEVNWISVPWLRQASLGPAILLYLYCSDSISTHSLLQKPFLSVDRKPCLVPHKIRMLVINFLKPKLLNLFLIVLISHLYILKCVNMNEIVFILLNSTALINSWWERMSWINVMPEFYFWTYFFALNCKINFTSFCVF